MQVAGLRRACPSVTLDKLNIQLSFIIYDCGKNSKSFGQDFGGVRCNLAISMIKYQ
jgi:hypothetical protein